MGDGVPDTTVLGGPKEGAGPPELTAEAGAEAVAEVEDVAAVDPEADAAVGLGLLLVSNASVEVEGVGVDVEEVDDEEVEVVVEESSLVNVLPPLPYNKQENIHKQSLDLL